MLAPVDFGNIERALEDRAGWTELGILAMCLGIAWLVERRVVRAHAGDGGGRRLYASFARIVFPLTAIVMLVIATFAYRRYVGPTFFLAIAGPMLIALAAIRMIVYGLRRMFHTESWLPTSERAISLTVWALVLLYFLGLLPEIAAGLNDVQIPVGKSHVSLMAIGSAVLAVVFTLIVTLWVSGLIEQRLARATQIDANLRELLSKVIRAVLLLVAVLVALSTIGFDLTLLSVFGGALGVGIGLGLQKLASNYIAGFTILLDRSIRLGDMITVDGRVGAVSKVTSRYVVVRGLDGIEAIVPNETLVTTTVLNHSYTSRKVRVGLQVQISYDSDVDRALALMEEIARATPRVLAAPDAPAAFVANLGADGILLELGFWIDDPEKGQLVLRSAINRALLKSFAENGIRMPVTQREIRIVAGAGALAPTPDRPPV